MRGFRTAPQPAQSAAAELHAPRIRLVVTAHVAIQDKCVVTANAAPQATPVVRTVLAARQDKFAAMESAVRRARLAATESVAPQDRRAATACAASQASPAATGDAATGHAAMAGAAKQTRCVVTAAVWISVCPGPEGVQIDSPSRCFLFWRAIDKCAAQLLTVYDISCGSGCAG